ncbi:MAG: Dam family site-specific DNA-(adenine-N6)-methyltransferase [Scytolyngbya sp. HA4215-MV1]|jgi:DNA adenine methylase|nr:Dam family site-specific DNA-(adenine-N6)-methyltransferase [Scytolyngbya sp. HA4215-MV1]
MTLLQTPPPLLRPALKWAGGKRWLVPTLWELWKPHTRRRLVEPFVGSLAVALGLQPRYALLCDRNPHLINFYHWLQHGLRIDLPLENNAQTYYQFRDRFNELALTEAAVSAEAAQLFYYLNRTGFNGLCRFNSRGLFNVPFGRYKVINYAQDFLDYVSILKNWTFKVSDFRDLPIESGDFIYADPPYDVEFTRYSRDNFTWHDQVRLAEWLARYRGPVVLSNQATERIIDLYERLGFTIRILEGPRRISCTGDRTPAKEILACKGM